MLKIIGIAPISTGELVVDPYVPLSFRSYDTVPYLWRIGDFHRSLLEISIEQSTGILYDVTLTLPGSSMLANLPTGYELVPEKIGLPIIEISAITWEGEYIGIWDEKHEFSLLLKNDAVYIVFDSSLNPSSCISVDRVTFFEAESVLCGIGFFSLAPEEIALLKKYFIKV
ncbi:hypothetical protein KDW_41360 [Dictyobacter vulcani]|uniref:Uncharacterized protein n=1 Tax=Dictyobacter vulcani TaxID=2607529 RepID=A0A5J4KKP9_9CHLR|nr:hypothetical protein [Dictyobacter vulcani]GER89966.1 hypothetical protein KDW_41280 [Dictyobacter vulcani]GER89974.1 hypothetical protein KDW_41360 [Dictyobacter vulcani]